MFLWTLFVNLNMWVVLIQLLCIVRRYYVVTYCAIPTGRVRPAAQLHVSGSAQARAKTKDKLILYTRHLIWMWIAWSATNGRGEQWPAPMIPPFCFIPAESKKSKRSTDNSVLWYGHSNGGSARRLIAYNIKRTW